MSAAKKWNPTGHVQVTWSVQPYEFDYDGRVHFNGREVASCRFAGDVSPELLKSWVLGKVNEAMARALDDRGVIVLGAYNAAISEVDGRPGVVRIEIPGCKTTTLPMDFDTLRKPQSSWPTPYLGAIRAVIGLMIAEAKDKAFSPLEFNDKPTVIIP